MIIPAAIVVCVCALQDCMHQFDTHDLGTMVGGWNARYKWYWGKC